MSFDLAAYAYGVASCISQSLYLVLVQKSGQVLSAGETLHLNSYNTLPFLAILWIISGEFFPSMAKFNFSNYGFVFMYIVVITMGCLLNFLLFLCTMYNSALTTSLAGVLKSIVQTIIGMFTFGGISINIFTISGITINLSGAIIYVIAKYKEQLKKTLKANSNEGV